MPQPIEPLTAHPGTLTGFEITRFAFPRDRVIGDSQVRATMVNLAVLEVEAGGRIGTGFLASLFHPLPDAAELVRSFAEEAWPGLAGERPDVLLHRLTRPRGGNNRALPYGFGDAIDQALWDLLAQVAGLPLWRLLGGREGRVRAYASGLDYHLGDDDYAAFFAQAKAKGFGAFKIKVGHPDLTWDLHRLALLRDVVGPGATVMVDANEAWTPKEAIRRLHAYRDAGHAIFWIEDPCPREDFAGLRQVAEAVPFAHLNTGEYLDNSGKRRLIEARAVDILNVHGKFSDIRKIAWLAAEHGIEISLGNTAMELGVHSACSLPECRWLEYSFQNYGFLCGDAVRFEEGWAIAPDRPGHGLALTDDARRDFACPGVDDRARGGLPPPPIRLTTPSPTA